MSMNIRSIKDKLGNIYFLNSMLPIMVIYIVNSILWTSPFYQHNIQPFTQVFITIYASLLAVFNVFMGRLKQGKRLIIIPFICFALYNLLSYLVVDRGDSFYALSVVCMIFINFLAFGLPRTDLQFEQRRNEVLITIYSFLVCSTLWNIVLVIIQASTEGFGGILNGAVRLSGISENPNRLAYFSSMAIFWASFMCINEKKRSRKIFAIFCLLFDVVILVMTGCRNAQIFLLTSYLILFLIYVNRKYSRKIFWGSLIVISLIGICGILLITLSRGVDTSLNGYQMLNKLSSNRLNLFVKGINAGFDSPLFGNSYSYLSEQYATVTMAHNLYIDLFARYGLPSLAFFLVFIVSLIWFSLKLIKKSKNMDFEKQDIVLFCFCFSMLVGMLVQHLFDVYIFLSGYGSGNVFFIIITSYMIYLISKYAPDGKTKPDD